MIRPIALAALLLLATPAAAQRDFSKVEIRTEQVRPGVHVLFGEGGNIGVSSGADGVFLVDDQFAPLTPKIVEAVSKISERPIRFVLNTHWHSDHTGGNENLGKRGAVIVAHDNVRRRMSTEQLMRAFDRTVPASPPGALPVITFNETTTFHLNGDEIHVLHVPHAHTDGDALVHFRKANALHMGDTYFSEGYPFIDLSSGGSVQGLIAAHDRALALTNAQSRIIPGHGRITDRAALASYQAMLKDLVARIAPMVRAGRTLEEVLAAKPSAQYDAKFGGGFINPTQIVTFVYESLKNGPAHSPAGHQH